MEQLERIIFQLEVFEEVTTSANYNVRVCTAEGYLRNLFMWSRTQVCEAHAFLFVPTPKNKLGVRSAGNCSDDFFILWTELN